MNHQDLGGKVGTALASIGSFIAAFVQSDIIINELVRLFSSCIIAGVGALIGYYVTKILRRMDDVRKQKDLPNINPGSKAPEKLSSRARKAALRKYFATKSKRDDS